MSKLQVGTDSKSNYWSKLFVVIGKKQWVGDWVGSSCMCFIPITGDWYRRIYPIRKSIKYTSVRAMVGTLSDTHTEYYALTAIRSAIKEQIWKFTDPLYIEDDRMDAKNPRIYIDLKFNKTFKRGGKTWYKS